LFGLSFTNNKKLTTNYYLLHLRISPGDDDDDCIELPGSLFSSLSAADGAAADEILVSVRALVSVKNATRPLSVEPLTVEDWELLQFHAAWLERGGLLRQVSLVYPHQVVPLRLDNSNSNDVARVRVADWNANNSVWPEEDETNNSSSNNCLRLLAETEIVVTPKPRSRKIGTAVTLRTTPCRQDYSDAAMADLWAATTTTEQSSPLITVAPNAVALHPNTLAKLLDYSMTTNRGENERIIAELRLECSEQEATTITTTPQSPSAIVAVTSSDTVAEDYIGEFRCHYFCHGPVP